jgi:nucleoside-diphosphate-sugar epimerase
VVQADLSTPQNLRVLPSRVDSVVHLAQSSLFRDWPEVDATQNIFGVNVLATQALLEYAQQAGATQFLQASTGSVYSPSSQPQSEQAPLAPSGYYAATKLAAEALARPYDALFATCALRLFFPYGPGQTGRLMNDLIGRVKSGRAISLRGDADGFRFNPTYVDDVVAVIVHAIEAQWRGIVNVASPETISLREAGHLIGLAMGRDAVFEFLDGAPPLPILPALDEFHARLPGFRCRSFADGIHATVAAEPA